MTEEKIQTEQEQVKIGELYLASTKINADKLTKIAIKTLKNPIVKSYLNGVEHKKRSHTYTG